MPPSLKISLGPNVDELKEISYNDGSTHVIQSELFDGVVSVHIKGDFGDTNSSKSTYFNDESRARHTWSIALQGRFLKAINGNDILFGNIFDRPLTLPWGFGILTQVSSTIYTERSHGSPFLSTMPYLQRIELDPATPIPRDMLGPITVERSIPPLAPVLESESTPAERRKYFTDESHRKEVTFTPRDLIQADFVHGYLQFPSLTMALPGGLQFDLMYYYDSRPVSRQIEYAEQVR
ncbi:hypothetical protein AG1IA_04260 [Rhizoctonia solani AG-1 IA]|uniref:Domain of unknown function at the cortex 1 domain-containing protein n=1 Tax=Thanatephorus cucumeris (strain AG1-IA) TaxID=983506 RepID=L8WY15_THACA|nr:hypothetical protein AG1IA_04260 [Rhizoctonia solani AG-1 IA]